MGFATSSFRKASRGRLASLQPGHHCPSRTIEVCLAACVCIGPIWARVVNWRNDVLNGTLPRWKPKFSSANFWTFVLQKLLNEFGLISDKFYVKWFNGCHLECLKVWLIMTTSVVVTVVWILDSLQHVMHPRFCLYMRKQSNNVGMPYEVALSLTQIVSLHDRREHLNIFFTSITIPSSCISRLLPPLRDSSITSRLRRPTPSL